MNLVACTAERKNIREAKSDFKESELQAWEVKYEGKELLPGK